MNRGNFEVLNRDFQEIRRITKLFMRMKLFYYFLQRPIADYILRRILEKILKDKKIYDNIDKFLLNEGGMFKDHVYKICNRFYPIKNSFVLVPGVGYGKNLFQLAAFQPKLIIGFDLYEHKEEWGFLKNKVKEEFGVEAMFLKGDFDIIDKKYVNYFDFIISDAVLEHVKDLNKFIAYSKKFLKNGGVFYASFGPIWYGPGGDHIDWGKNKFFDHLLLPQIDYEKQFCSKFSKKEIENNSCEGIFMVRENLFSYLKIEDYFDILSKNGFQKLLLFTKISDKALKLLSKNKNLNSLLDNKKIPKFDRFCSGIYLWMKLEK